ncbi:MAG: cation-translocating P-type ATPase [Chloroflexi bacterium]|nr:cation-translocating P-type ATPase [Chloroflexota bacterium]
MRGDAPRAAALGAALAELPGVEAAGVNARTGRALLVFESAIDGLEALVERIANLAASVQPAEAGTAKRRMPSTTSEFGAPSPSGAIDAATSPVPAGPQPLAREWSRVLTGGAVVVAVALVRLIGGPLALAAPPVALVATGATLLVGIPTFASGLRPLLRLRPPEIDTLITTATFASLLLGEPVTGLVVVWLIALGELVEEMTLDRTRRAIADLLAVGEEWVWVVAGGEQALPAGEPALGAGTADQVLESAGAHEVRVRLEEVQAGDVVVVHAGEKIPVDGRVLRGAASVNQAPITGESIPVFRNPGDEVFAGTLLEGGALLVRAERVGAETTIGRIIGLVEKAREVQAPIQRLADRFSRRTVPLSFVLAAGVFLLTRDVLRTITILVIACPCAAGLATPTAVSAAIARAARRGILNQGRPLPRACRRHRRRRVRQDRHAHRRCATCDARACADRPQLARARPGARRLRRVALAASARRRRAAPHRRARD